MGQDEVLITENIACKARGFESHALSVEGERGPKGRKGLHMYSGVIFTFPSGACLIPRGP